MAALLVLGMPSGEVPGGETATPPAPWPITVAREAFDEHGQAGYLAAVLNLLDREAEAMASDKVRNLFLDYLGTHLVLVGEHERATKASDKAYGGRGIQPDTPDGDPLASYRPVAALKTIVLASTDRSLVMVNEEHRSTIQRAFSNGLLKPLRELGFTYLAVEAVGTDIDGLNERGYPVLKTGLYTRDPAFGDLIRRALALGYTILAYEAGDEGRPRPDDKSPADAMNRRERGQARNIFDQTFARNPAARVLVIGGRGHIAESAGPIWTPMGGILKELSGIDPLTVNLYTMVEHSKPEFEHWAFKTVNDRGWTDDGPVLLVNDDGAYWSGTPGAVDAHVIHPRTRYVHGRPHWMSMAGLRRAIHFDAATFDGPVLLQAHLSGERDDAVPMDQVVLWPGAPASALFLRPGNYRLRVIDRNGNQLRSVERTVASAD